MALSHRTEQKVMFKRTAKSTCCVATQYLGTWTWCQALYFEQPRWRHLSVKAIYGGVLGIGVQKERNLKTRGHYWKKKKRKKKKTLQKFLDILQRVTNTTSDPLKTISHSLLLHVDFFSQMNKLFQQCVFFFLKWDTKSIEQSALERIKKVM